VTHVTGDGVVAAAPRQSGPDHGKLVQGVVLGLAVVADEDVKTVVSGDDIVLRTAEDDVVAKAAVDLIRPALERNVGVVMIQFDGRQIRRKIKFVWQMLLDRHIPHLGIIDAAVVAEDDFCAVIGTAAVDDVMAGAAKDDVRMLGVIVAALSFLIDPVVSAVCGIPAFEDFDDIALAALHPCAVAAFMIDPGAAVDDVAADTVCIRVSGAADDDVVAWTAPQIIPAAVCRVRGPYIVYHTRSVGIGQGIGIDANHNAVVAQYGVSRTVPPAVYGIVAGAAYQDIRTPRVDRLAAAAHVYVIVAAVTRIVDPVFIRPGVQPFHHIEGAPFDIPVVTQNDVCAVIAGKRVTDIARRFGGIVVF